VAGHARATNGVVSAPLAAAVVARPASVAGSVARDAHRALAKAPQTRVGRTLRELLGVEAGGGSGLSFYAALRRLECHFRDKPRFGEAAHPADDTVRLAQDPSLAFRPQAITALQDASAERPARVAVGFFGAFGPHGPLPTHLTEYAFERKHHHGDGAFIGFFDIFHHRLLSVFFRAWAEAQPTVSHDRIEDDRFARRLGSLIGLTSALGDEPYSEIDYACLYSAGHFAGQTRHPEGLVKTLQASFGVPVRIEEFVGSWLPIPDATCWRIPDGDGQRPREASPPLGVLGESTRVGTEVYDQQSAFVVVLGPLGRADYERFLPGGPHLPRLVELVERYAGVELRWTLRLILREPERRAAVLGVEGSIALTAHLAAAEDTVYQEFEDLLIDPEQLFRTARRRPTPRAD